MNLEVSEKTEKEEVLLHPDRMDLYVKMLEIFFEWAVTVPEIAGVDMPVALPNNHN